MSSNKFPSRQRLISATGLLYSISLPTSNVMTVLLLSVICVAITFLPVFWRDSNGNPQRLQGGSCRGNDQRARQPRRFCRTGTRSDISALKPDLSSPDSWC